MWILLFVHHALLSSSMTFCSLKKYPFCWTSFLHVTLFTIIFFCNRLLVCFSLSSVSLHIFPIFSLWLFHLLFAFLLQHYGSQLVASINFSMDPLATPIVSCCWFLFPCCFLSFCLAFWQSLGCLDYCLENYWFPAVVITNSLQIF